LILTTSKILDFNRSCIYNKNMNQNPPKLEEPNPAGLIAGQCLAARVRLLNRAVTRIYDHALKPLGVKLTQMNLLVAVGVCGTARPEEIYRALALDKSTLSRNTRRLEEKGLLNIRAGEDQRAKELSLTEKGLELIKASLPGWEKAQEEARSLLGEKGAEAIQEMTLRLWSKLG
jgi:DNA-binding MarR family transcriptional regulator